MQTEAGLIRLTARMSHRLCSTIDRDSSRDGCISFPVSPKSFYQLKTLPLVFLDLSVTQLSPLRPVCCCGFLVTAVSVADCDSDM